jgi:hypothetical protein
VPDGYSPNSTAAFPHARFFFGCNLSSLQDFPALMFCLPCKSRGSLLAKLAILATAKMRIRG